ncbi:MAG: MBL fold metallo-hydrolase [Verrucomicrobiales bacterium]
MQQVGEFEITFLGTGTSIGIPVIGCDCPVCLSDDPFNKRLRSAIHVRTPDRCFLVDAGPDLRQQCLRAGITELDAVLITHSHTDHIMGFDDLRRFTLGRERSLPVYATPASLEDLMRVFSFAFDGENRYPGYLKPDPMPVEGPFQLGSTRVIPLPVRHGKVDTVGYLFEPQGGEPLRIAYIPDLKEALPETVEALREIDVLIIDALRHTPHPTHMNFEEALAFADEIGAAQTWFTHIACQIDHREVEKTLPARVRIAYDGLVLSL